MDRLKDKVAIVTGGAFGIGKATSIQLAKEGAKVAMTDIDDDAGTDTVRTIASDDDIAWYWHMDVSDEDEVQKVIEQIKEKFGKIDILVNNAGIAGANKATHELTNKEWNKVIQINVNGVFYCTKHVLPYMIKSGGGSIVNLSSIYGIISAPDIPPYHASKGAVRSMTKTDALLYAKNNIRVNSVHPGFIWTPLVENLAKKSPEGLEKYRKGLENLHPVGHLG